MIYLLHFIYSHSSGLESVSSDSAILHTLQLTVTRALRLSVFTSRILATDL
jgi:hypothetical protein